MLNIIQKDLIKAFKENEINVLIQQCNCFHTQNAGLAKSIKQEYPEVLNVDLQHPTGIKASLEHSLMQCQSVRILARQGILLISMVNIVMVKACRQIMMHSAKDLIVL